MWWLKSIARDSVIPGRLFDFVFFDGYGNRFEFDDSIYGCLLGHNDRAVQSSCYLGVGQ